MSHIDDQFRIFIGRIPKRLGEPEVQSYFETFGSVIDVFLPDKNNPTKETNICFVKFAEEGALKKCLALAHHTLGGVPITVVQAKPKNAAPDPFAPSIPKASVQVEENNRLFVGGIPANTDEEVLKGIFSAFGEIIDFFRPGNQLTEANGYAFVKFANEKACFRALGAESHKVGDAELTVTMARPKPAKDAAYGAPQPTFTAYNPYDLPVASPYAPPPQRAPKNYRIFVGQILPGTTDEDLQQYFSQFGKVTRVHRPTRQSQGHEYAFISYSTLHELSAVLSAGVHSIKGAPLKVMRARDPGDRNEAPRAPAVPYATMAPQLSFPDPYASAAAAAAGYSPYTHEVPRQSPGAPPAPAPAHPYAAAGVYGAYAPGVAVAPAADYAAAYTYGAADAKTGKAVPRYAPY